MRQIDRFHQQIRVIMEQYNMITDYEQKLKEWMAENKVQAEHHSFNQSCHSVEEAAQVVGGEPEDFVKNICMIDLEGNLIVAIVKGEDKVSLDNVAADLGTSKSKIRIAKPEEMLEKSGYPCGGTPSFGYSARFLVDERVMEKEIVYTGGGSETSLIKVSPKELLNANRGQIAKLR